MARLRTVFSRRVLALLVVVIGVSSVWPLVWADPSPPTAEDRQISQLVTLLLRREHLTKHPLDEEISSRTVTQFVKTLDPMKVYFYQSDIDAFRARQDEVHTLTRKGDTRLATFIFQTFLQRVDERVKQVDELLAMDHDFTVDEEILVDREAAQFPKDAAEARDLWRKRIKYDLLVLKADQIEKQRSGKKDKTAKEEPEAKLSPADAAKEAIDRLGRRYHNFAKRMHQTDHEELLEMYLTAICSSFDPHTSYMSPDTLNNFEIQMRLNLEGIGAALQSQDGYTVINKILPGGPAEKDGRLKVDDKIVGVGQGKDGAIEDVVDMKLSDVVKLIRGPKGTTVRLQFVRGRSQERKIIEITRAAVELKDSEARSKVFEAGKKPDGRPFKIGVIDLPSFYMDMAGARAGLPNFKSTTRDVRRILGEFNQQGVDAMVLDLRRNGGGSLQEAISLTGLFIDDGPVVQVKDSDGRIHPYNDVESGMAWKGPMVVLISKFSASASEILAGAIQDYGRGLIVGDHATHGKGTVQSLRDLSEDLFRNIPNAPKMGALKITMQQFYRPGGDSTQRRGVLADVEWPSITSHLEDISEADLDYAIPFDRVPALDFQKFNQVTKPVVERLRALSTSRVQAAPEFQKVQRNIARYEEQKKRKFVTLNEKKFLEERSELNADREEEKQIEELNENSGEIKRDHYIDEALAIAVDYLQLAFATKESQAVQAVRE